MAVETLRPNGAGTRTDLTAVPAGNNWSRVDEDPANDADYVKEPVEESEDFDTYATADSGIGAGVITNVRVVMRGRFTEE